MECDCPYPWTGAPDCSLQVCPKHVPYYMKTRAADNTALTKGVECSGQGGGTLAGQFRVGVLGHYVYINANADTTTNTVLDTALESLGAIKSVTVTRGTVDVNKGAAYTVTYTGNYIDLFSVSPVGADNALHFRSSDGNTSLLTLSSFGDLKLMAVTNSTSTTTGTLTHEGGMSIGKKLYAGTINIKATAAASSKTTGALITKGGLSVAKAMYVGNALALTMSGVVDTVMPYKGVFGDLDFRDTGGFADHDDASGSTQRSSTPICYFNSKIHTAGGVSVTTGSSMTVTQTASSSFTGSLLKLGATVASNVNFELINSVTTFASTNWTKEGVGAWYLNNTGTSALMVTGQGKALLGGGLLTAGTAGVELQNGGSVTITAGGVNVTSGNIVLGTTGATTITQVGANDGSSDFVWSSTNARVVIENVYFETGQLYGYKSDIKVLTSSTTLASTDNEAHVWLAASGGFQVTLPNCQTSIIGTRFKFFVKTATTTGYVITRAGSSNDEMLGGLVVADETSAHSTTFHTIEDNAISINLINGNTGYGGAPGTEFEAICSADNLWFVTGHVLNGQNSPTGKYLSLGGLQFLVIKDNNDNTIDLNVEFKSGSSTGSGNAISYTGQPVSRATSLRLTATFVEGGVEANIGGGTTTDGTFQITVTKPAHVVSAVSLTDQADNAIAVNFNQGTYAGYTGQGTATGTSLKITVTFASGTTTAFTNSNTAQSLSTATAASDTTNFALNCGSNSLTITHSTDGKITLTITRLCAVSAVALKDHADNTISLSFTAGTLTGYTAVSLPTATSVKLTATFSSGTAQSKTGSNTLQAVTSGSQLVDATNLAIAFGDNTLAIVHSQDGTFSITVNRPGFASEPSISSISHVGFVVTADPANDVNIRCSVYADGAAAPTAAQVNSGVGASSAAVGATNGPVVNVVAAGKTNSGDAHSVTYTGLSGGTNYDVYCATADSTPILSAKADILTTGFTAQPTVANIAPSSFDVTSDPGADVNIRCAVFADGATAPTAAEVNAGTGTGGANYNATNGPITIPPAAGKTNSGDAHTITFTGLSSSTAYDIYCATADSTPVLSNKVDTTTS
eukprot:g199.t1